MLIILGFRACPRARVTALLNNPSGESSGHVAWGTLLYVHKLLATYYLGRGEPNRALHHFSEVIACSTDEVRDSVGSWGRFGILH